MCVINVVVLSYFVFHGKHLTGTTNRMFTHGIADNAAGVVASYGARL